MSRVGKSPIGVPAGVDVSVAGGAISVKGPLGSLVQRLHPLITVEREGAELLVKPVDGSRPADAMSGTFRALIANMVHGVSKGFERKLQLVGTGYRVQVQGTNLNLSLGFSHPVVYQVPQGVRAEAPTQTEILIKGADKQCVGQVAAEIRAFREPEPYKGKGVRYADERVVLKEVKKK